MQDRGFKSVLVTKLGTPEYRAPDIYIDTPGSIVGGTGARRGAGVAGDGHAARIRPRDAAAAVGRG